MPVIYTHVSTSTTKEQRDRLKASFGAAISILPGKSESWLMCPFDDNVPIYFAGDDSTPAAYVEVNVFGRQPVDASTWEKLSKAILSALDDELGIPQDRVYVREMASGDWGWNGGNF
ncbi:MAG: hypothetical protein LKI93_00770 [Bifidobacteriaceae bacterium]|jgi:phenylpyruvate tautomerase PptA (4-oxalocrotonate tautomerase family)|nr:hypothetical protein [Bifidobacteriaceae bacterium]MCI1915050.1 hypothetical protein [Bifidobacteriaceae bacterium]